MEFKDTIAEQQYMEEKDCNLHQSDEHANQCMELVYIVTEQVCQTLEEEIRGNPASVYMLSDLVDDTVNTCDPGMSSYQYDIVMHLIRKYWIYGDKLDDGDD